MKKLWAFLLAFAMVAAMGAPALAEDTTADTNTATNNGSTTDIAVNGQHTPIITPEIISVDIAWDAMDFTYNKKGDVWDPATHTNTKNEAAEGWVWDHKTDEQKWPYIRVINHSNINITADPAFNSVDGLSINCGFDSVPATLFLRSAEDTLTDNPPYSETHFEIYTSSSDGITESKDIGTLTVTIKKGETTRVADEKGLNEMYITTPSVVLTNDIELTEQLSRENFAGIIDLAGHTLTCDVNNGNKGSIYFAGGMPSVKKGHLVTIKNGTITGSAQRLLHFGQDSSGAVDVTMKNCTINTTNTDGNNASAIWVQGATLRLQDCTINSAGAVGLNVTTNSRYGGVGKAILSGNIRIYSNQLISDEGEDPVTCLAGTYNFNPTQYVDEQNYTVTPNEDGTIWTVTETQTQNQLNIKTKNKRSITTHEKTDCICSGIYNGSRHGSTGTG